MKTKIAIQRCLPLLSAGIMTSIISGFILLMFSVTSTIFAQNPITVENALTGNLPSEWEIYGEDESIQGFATTLSVNKGETVQFKIDVDPAVNFTMKIYRVGYYQGNGARLQADLGTIAGIEQPDPLYYSNFGTTDCSNWSFSAQWTVPESAVSGIYFAKIVRTDGGANHITFIVRDDAANSPILYKTSDGTWQAYNIYGGHSLYCGPFIDDLGNSFSHAVKVSYQRPFITRFVGCVGGPNEWFRNAEYPLIRWMERNGYNVTYTTQWDMSRNSTPITPNMHKILISAGHDEYWSAECRTAWETARNNGVNLCFMSGNEVYWKTRWEDNYQTLVCYKEGTMGEYICGGNCDPTLTWTGLWRDGCGLTYTPYANDGCNNENKLTGQMSWVAAETAITVPAAFKNMRFWKNTAVAGLSAGGSITLTPGSLGREWDYYQYAETYPPRRILLSETHASGLLHNLSLYRHSSGALVFGTGSEQWSWGLDAVHDRGGSPVDINMQQATVNLFAYMGVPPDPAYLQPDLYAEMGTYSATPPTTVITSPLNGSSLQSSTVTITGTASAPEGAVLFGIEVSVDGGNTWYTASGTTSWTFSWNPNQQGTHIIKSRGWDDLGNMEIPGPVGSSNCISVTFNGPSMYSVFLPNQPSGSPSNSSGSPLEVGMKFKSSADGFVTALKYYKNAGTTGEHIGNLWTASGTNLASVVFANETSFGWQVAYLPTPVAITANTIYIVSYFSPSGQFAYTTPYFISDVTNFLLTAPSSTVSSPNGVYKYTGSSSFPSGGAYNPSYNYWADVNFSTILGQDEIPPSVISIFPLSNATGVPILTNPYAIFSEALNQSTINTNTFVVKDAGSNQVAGSVTYNSGSYKATFTPSVPFLYSSTYTVTLAGGSTDPRIKDPSGNALVGNFVWSFTTENLYTPSITLHPASLSTCAGTIANFVSAATGNPPPTLQWQESLDNGNNWADINGATTSPFSYTVTIDDNDKQFRAIWTNSGGSEASNPATLTVIGAISATVAPVNDNICPGDHFQLQLTQASGQPPYTLVINGKTYSGVTTGQGSIFATIPTADETIWNSSTIPAIADNGSSDPYELGVRFKPIADGYIKGVRFYKGIGNTGTHIGKLWSATGTLLASATFSSETATGWQQVLFTNPVAVTAHTTYVASYSDPAGHFSQTMPYFNSTPVTSAHGLLQTIPSPYGSPANGVYSLTVGAFPSITYIESPNYWVDVVYAYSINTQTVTNNITSIADNGSCTVTGNPISSVTVTINNPGAPVVNSPVVYAMGATAAQLTATGSNLLWYTTPSGGTGNPAAPIPSTAIPSTTMYYVSQTVNGCESARAQLAVVITGEGEWYDNYWQYRSPIVITNPAGTTLTDYQVLISLNNSFDFAKAKSDGGDIRAADADGTTMIPFWIESWDAITQQAKIWVKIPVIPSGGLTVYLYYGNPAATAASNGNSTFILFDDTWISSSGNLNPVQVATQHWWENTVSYPIVFEDNSFLPDRPRFHMLYDGHDAIGHAKGYSTSPNLVNWTAYDNGLSGNARINPNMGVGYSGGTQFAWGDFIKVGSTYHMYPSSGPGTTVHCQSTDLIHWTNQSGSSVTFDVLSTNDPSGIGTGVAILKEADGKTPVVVDNKYWMIYFHGFSGGSMYMAYADVGNLLSWTTCYSGSPVLTPSGWEGGGLWTPSFVKVNDKYYIYYQAGSPYKIGFASAPSTSSGNPVRPDNTPWTKSPNNPVITNTHGWDNGFCQDPVLRCFDGVYYCFYTGDAPWTNGFATSTSPEGPWVQYGQSGGGGVGWTKTGTPVVSNGIISFASGQAIQSPATYSPGTAVGFRANFGPQGGDENRWGGFITGTGGTTPPDRAMIQKQVAPYAPSNNYAYLSTHPTYTELSLLDNQFHVYEVLWRTGRVDAIFDHGSAISAVNNVPSSSLPLTFYNYAGTSPLQVDWAFVRKYISPEPQTALGNQQINCPPPVPLVTSPVTYCQGATAVALTATGINLLWYTQPTSGTGSSTAPVPSTTSVGTTSYYVSQTINSCEGPRAQLDVDVNPTPASPAVEIIQPTCSLPTGTITVTPPPTGMWFSLDGINYSNTTGIFTGVNPGNYNLTAKNSFGCISSATPVTIDAVTGAPPAPTATVTQPTCSVSTGTINITAPTGAGMTYSKDGIDYTNTTGVFTEIAPGTYSLTAKDSQGCISPATSKTVNPAPGTPPAPTASITQPTCSVAAGTITITAPTGTGMTYSKDGIDYSNTTGIFTGVTPGTYNLTAKNSSNCISPITTVTVNAGSSPPAATIAAVNNNLCYGDPSYQLQLASATGQAPYSLVVDGVTSTGVSVGQVFTTVSVTQSVWNNSTTVGGTGGGASYELGVKFRSTASGYIRGIRYYKATSNIGVHYGRLWSITGTKLAEATFTSETASGWQEVLFATPVAITANIVYVASYNVTAPGLFHYNPGYFNSSYNNGNLFLLSNTDPNYPGNGVYNGTPGTFPATGTGSNYWVDVVFSTWNALPTTITSNLTNITDANGCSNSGSPLSTASVTINATPTGTISSAGAACDGSNMRLIFNATAGNSPFSLVVNGYNYNGITSGVAFNVGTTGTSQPQSIWPNTNGTDNGANTSSLELGVKFRSSVPGQITGIRFYKVGTNTAGYSGTLWSGSGTQLATANFPALPTNGWQQINFTTPVSIQSNTTYVASYHVPTGNFAANQGYFATSGVTNGALTALKDGVDGGNGVYVINASITFPITTYNSTNYWVDVVFVPATNNYFELTSITSANGCVKTGNPISTTIVPVNPLPTVTWTNSLTNQCASSSSYVLTGGLPVGGTYSGAGVSGGVFNASLAGTGLHTLTYTYTNPTTQCSNSAINTITVYALPLASASSNSPVMAGSPLNLYSGPAGMTSYLWSGPASFSSNVANPTRYPALLSYGGTYSVIATDANGCSATASTDVIVNESNAIVSGNIKYFNGTITPLQNVNIKLQQNSIDKYTTAPTGSSGEYTFTNVAPGFYDVVASTTTNANPVGGINVTDAAQTNYWGVFFSTIEKVRFLAGDVTGDNNITSNDASNILQYFLTQGYPDPPFSGSAWRFWKTEDLIGSNPFLSSYPTINVSGSNVTQNLYGLVTGDFNQSFVPGGMKAVSESLTLIYGETISVIPDMEFDLPLSAAMDMEVGAVSLIMEFPSDLLEVNGVYLSDDPNAPLMHTVSGDELRIGWNSLEPISLLDGESLLTLKVKLIGLPGEEGIRFKLAADPLNELADGDYNVIDNAVLSIDVITTSITGTGEITLSDRLTLANHPNPFTGKTTFAYSIPVDGKVTLEIYDIVGNKVRSLVDVTQSAGDYVLSLDEATLQPGVYTATIKLNSNGNLMTRTIKIVSKQ